MDLSSPFRGTGGFPYLCSRYKPRYRLRPRESEDLGRKVRTAQSNAPVKSRVPGSRFRGNVGNRKCHRK